MSQEGMSRIKSKLQELTAIIKEEAIGESQEIKNDLLKAINDVKKNFDERWAEVGEKSKDALGEAKDDLHDIVRELEAKALKVQYSVQEKYSESMGKKDEVVVKTADSLIEAIEKVKCALAARDCEQKKD